MPTGNGNPTPGEIGRSLQRIEAQLERMEAQHDDEQSRQRHRINNIDLVIEGQRIILTEASKRMDKLEESIKWAFRMLASAFVGLVIQAGFLVLVK